MNYDWPLIGHQKIKDRFARLLSHGTLAHAYLFLGPSEVGKYAFARMLATTLLCTAEGSRPCSTCQGCRAVGGNVHPDLVIIERDPEKSSLSIERIRAFIATIATKPLLGSYRIGIIRDADLLTTEAANALLKTLEEPGAQVALFLTSERTPIPTIVSRCQTVTFQLVPELQIEKGLARISGFEDAVVRNEIAQLAWGCPGKALSLSSPGVMAEYKEAVRDIFAVMSKTEGDRLLWSAEHLTQGEVGERREYLGRMITIIVSLLADLVTLRLKSHPRLQYPFLESELTRQVTQCSEKMVAQWFTKCTQAKTFMAANVDPRLISEYLLLEGTLPHNLHEYIRV